MFIELAHTSVGSEIRSQDPVYVSISALFLLISLVTLIMAHQIQAVIRFIADTSTRDANSFGELFHSFTLFNVDPPLTTVS
jgi:hypothetical protein